MAFDLKRAPRFESGEPQKSVGHPTVLLLRDDREVAALLTNISCSGFTADPKLPITTGDRLGIAIPGYSILEAELRRTSGLEFGAEFVRDLADKQVEAL